jgi:hypothetical protein
MAENKLSAADVAADIKSQLDVAAEQEVLSRPVITTDTKPDPKVVEIVKAETAKAIKEAPKRTMLGGTTRRAKRAKDMVSIHLTNFKESTNYVGRIAALSKLVDVFNKYPTEAALNEALEFFRENKNAAFMQESVALQGITSLDMMTNHRIRIMYTVLLGMARGTIGRRNIGIDYVRNVFNNDVVPNWIANKLNPRK